MATGALSTAADPWAGIRQLKFSQRTVEQPGVAVSDSYSTNPYTETLWGVDQDALNAGGFNTKYQGVPEEVEPGLFKITVQRPGMHKYDTAEAYYRVDPETGMGVMVDDPTATRQTSSKDKWQDRLEKRILPIAGTVLGAGAALGAAGYGAGLGGVTGGAAAPGAASGAMTAEQAAMLAANAPVGNAGGLAAWEAAQAGAAGAAGSLPAASGGLSGVDAAMADVAASGAITPSTMGGGMNWLDTALTAGKSVFGNDWLTTAMSLVGSGVNQYNIEKAAQDQRDWLDSKDTDRRRRQAPGALPAMKTTVYTKGGG